MKGNKIIDATVDEVEDAKQTAIALISDGTNANSIDDLFFETNLNKIEAGIRRLNDLSSKSWILSSILLYTLVYNNNAYMQSGLSWVEYGKQARERLGLDQRDITDQLSSARFFIRHHKAMERYGWTPKEANQKLARAEMALSLCGNLDQVLKHLAKDSWRDFKDWYSSFKTTKALPPRTEYKRNDIDIKKSKVYIKGVEAVSVSSKIPKQDRERIEKYLVQIFEAMKLGYEPAIVPVYDEKEASILPRLRDKHRQGK